jgi:hypothetical protein
LNRQIRAWRRNRAELSWRDVLSEAYTAILSTILVALMLGNVLLGLREMGTAACVAECAPVRTSMAWICVLVLALAVAACARLLGPVFLPPATGPWLLSTPVDRADLLRPALTRALLIALAAAVLVLPVAALAGLGILDVALAVALGGVSCLCVMAVVASGQLRSHGGARALTWTLACATWAAMAWVGLAPSTLPSPSSAPFLRWWAIAPLTVLVAAVALWWVVRARRSLSQTPRSAMAGTQNAWPSLSGALAVMDFTLLFDVLVSRRWGAVPSVRSRRGGPEGWWAMVHTDLRRIRRSPQPWLALLGLLVVPYALTAADIGLAVAIVVALCGFLVGPSMSVGLRVACRTPTLSRLLGHSDAAVRGAHAVVPGVGLLIFAAASMPALAHSIGWERAGLIAIATGFSAVASTVRWVASAPPDYGRPLLTTPVGGLPPGFAGAILRGFDVWLITSLPLLLGDWGVWVSLAISAVVLAVCLTPARAAQAPRASTAGTPA